MPWCPKCKTEYRPGFDTCADCGAALVDEKPEECLSAATSRKMAAATSIVLTIVLYPILMFILPLWLPCTRDEAARVATTLSFICIFGFVRGIDNWKHTASAIVGFWVACSIAVVVIESRRTGSIPDALVQLATWAFVLAVPPILSAYLGSQWKRLGIQYLIIWVVLTAILTLMPYAIQWIWP